VSKVKAWSEQYNAILKPITNAQKEYHRRQSSKWILVHDKDGNATCTKCKSNITIHAKHKSKVICPECKEQMIVQHEWRMSKYIEIINWMVIPKAINNHVLCLRFIEAYQLGNKEMYIGEKARMFIDEYQAEYDCYCKFGNNWCKGKAPYFRVDTYMFPNKYACYNAYEYPRNFFKEINKLDCFKYYPAETEYSCEYYSTQLHYMVRSAKLNEKLNKVGMKDLVGYHRNYYINHGDRCYPMNHKATSLINMLKLDNYRYSILKKYPDIDMLICLQQNKNFNEADFELAERVISRYTKVNKLANKISVSFKKMYKYLSEGLSKGKRHYYDVFGEYDHYLWLCKELGYDIKDTYYSMPKDFRAADKKLTDEYNAKLEKEEAEKLAKKDGLIKKIADGLHAIPKLQEFFEGANGLFVYVPESSAELIREGKELHNCIGTYIDRIAEGKTNVFFVRKLDDPTAPFVAFEYCNGEIIQCRYNHNKTVEDTEIISFVDKFADALKAA